MPLKCKKCGFKLNNRLELEGLGLHITDDPNGYQCPRCFTKYSWVDGSALVHSWNAYNVALGEKEVKTNSRFKAM